MVERLSVHTLRMDNVRGTEPAVKVHEKPLAWRLLLVY
jgi:hypothetical protein